MKTLKLICLLFLILLCDCQARILRITTSVEDIQYVFDHSADGDTIMFSAGIYSLGENQRGDLQITKPLAIIGEEGTLLLFRILISSVDGCYLENLMLNNRNTPALSISYSKNIHMKEIILCGTDYGLTATQCDSIFISNSYMSAYQGYLDETPGPGAYFSSSTNIFIDSCKFKGDFNSYLKISANSLESVNSSKVFISNSKLISPSYADSSSSITASSTNIVVDDTNLQTMINNSSPNDTIRIPKGIYTGFNKINKPVSIIGENKLTVFLTLFMQVDSTNSIYIKNLTFIPLYLECITIDKCKDITLDQTRLIAGHCYPMIRFLNSGLKITLSDSIRILNSEITGRDSDYGMYETPRCWPAVYSISSTNISIDSCILKTGDAVTYAWSYNKFYQVDHPSTIIAIESSKISVSNSHLFSPAFSDSTSTIIFNNVIGVNDEEKEGGAPSSYFLSQNYPNPFNPTTIISYDLPAESFITLKVYDILGREIAVLVNEVQKAGNHKVNFNGAMLSSGIYIYKLQTNNHSYLKKMILQK